MPTAARIGYGARFLVIDPTISPGVEKDLGEVINISPPTKDLDIIDATHMQSANSTREYILGLIDPGEAAVEMNFIPGDETDDLLFAIEAARVAVQCRIVFPNLVTWTFLALLQSREFNVEVADKMTHTANWKVTGSVEVGVTT
jgi:hypothetical protein